VAKGVISLITCQLNLNIVNFKKNGFEICCLNRNSLIILILFFALAAYGQQISVAVLPSDGTAIGNEELEALTDEMRAAALKILPTDVFVLLKQDVVIKRLGGAENYIKECSQSSCIVNLGKKAQVDYVAQASVGKLGDKIRLKVELYSVRTEGMVGMLNGDAENVIDLLNIVKEKVPDEVFGKIPASGISGLQKAIAYELSGDKRYLALLSTEPSGAVLSFDGIPSSSCAKTPCKVELHEGNVRIIASLEQYEIADTTISIKQNNQNIAITLKPNFGVLEIQPAYLEGIGNNRQWNLTINDKPYSLGKIRLSPNRYAVKLSHECYENISFEAGINKGSHEVFDMAGNIVLKKGGLDLSAEADGEPVSEPVFVNGKQVGETPFSGAVPLCATIEIGANREKVDVEIEHKITKAYKHQMNIEKKQTAWMLGLRGPIGGGMSFNMNDIDPNYFKSSAVGHWTIINIEFYKQNLIFFRFGANLDLGGVSIDRNAVKRMHPNVLIDSVEGAIHLKLNAFARLYLADLLFLSGGVGWESYKAQSKGTKLGSKELETVDIVSISTPVFPIGGGICLCSSAGIVVEGLYNIVPFKGRTATYISINVGFIINESIIGNEKTKGGIK